MANPFLDLPSNFGGSSSTPVSSTDQPSGFDAPALAKINKQPKLPAPPRFARLAQKMAAPKVPRGFSG